MPKFLEEKLKKEYGANSDIPYKVMNKLGVMHGNKETKKGRAEEKKHQVAKKMLSPLDSDPKSPHHKEWSKGAEDWMKRRNAHVDRLTNFNKK